MTARTYEIIGADGVTLQDVLQGTAVSGADITPVTQLADASGVVIQPATASGQALANAALGAPADAAWGGAGAASLVAMLKALWVRLGDVSPLGAGLDSLGCRQVSVTVATDLATLMNESPPAGARALLLQVELGDVRLRDDGADPTASFGMLLRQDAVWRCSGDLGRLRLASAGAAPALINLAFYG